MDFNCPRGCKRKNGDPVANTIKGWKHHMSRAHGEYTDSELNTVLGTSPRDAEAGKAEFLSEADSVKPATEGWETNVNGPGYVDKKGSAPATDEQKTVELKTDQAAKRLSSKVNKFKQRVAEKFPHIVNDIVKDKGPEWALNDEDSKFLAESIENCFEILDVDFRITPITKTLTNPIWVLALPVLCLLLLFGGKLIRNAQMANEQPGGPDFPGPDTPGTVVA